MNDAAADLLALPALSPGLRGRLERGVIRRGPVLTWADSTGAAGGAPSLTAWECADSSFRLEEDTVDQRTLLIHGLAFAVRFGRLVRALDPPAPVRCIVAATETDATFRFHQIRPGEQ